MTLLSGSIAKLPADQLASQSVSEDIDYSDPIQLENLRAHLAHKYETSCHGTRSISSSRKKKRIVLRQSQLSQGQPTQWQEAPQLDQSSNAGLLMKSAASSPPPLPQQPHIQIVQVRPTRRQRDKFVISNTVPVNVMRSNIASKCLINEAQLSPMLLNCTPIQPPNSSRNAILPSRRKIDIIEYGKDKLTRMYDISGQIEVSQLCDKLNSARTATARQLHQTDVSKVHLQGSLSARNSRQFRSSQHRHYQHEGSHTSENPVTPRQRKLSDNKGAMAAHVQQDSRQITQSSANSSKQYRFTEDKRLDHQTIRNSGIYIRNNPLYLSDPEWKMFDELNRTYKPVNITNIESNYVAEEGLSKRNDVSMQQIRRSSLFNSNTHLIPNFRGQFLEAFSDALVPSHLSSESHVIQNKNSDGGNTVLMPRKILEEHERETVIFARQSDAMKKSGSYTKKNSKKADLVSPCFYINRNDRVRISKSIPSKKSQQQSTSSSETHQSGNIQDQHHLAEDNQRYEIDNTARQYSLYHPQFGEDPRQKYIRKQQEAQEIASLASTASVRKASVHSVQQSRSVNFDQSYQEEQIIENKPNKRSIVYVDPHKRRRGSAALGEFVFK